MLQGVWIESADPTQCRSASDEPSGVNNGPPKTLAESSNPADCQNEELRPIPTMQPPSTIYQPPPSTIYDTAGAGNAMGSDSQA